MNKMIKSAIMMASVGAMLCIVGCGEESLRDQFESTYREGSKAMGVYAEANGLEEALKKFDAATPEKQKEMLKSLKDECKRLINKDYLK